MASSRVGGIVNDSVIASTIEGKLLWRSRLVALGWVPIMGWYFCIRSDGSSQYVSKSAVHVAAVTSPVLVTLVLAATHPDGLTEHMTYYAHALMLIMTCADTKYAIDAWQSIEFSREVKLVRAFVPATFALGVTLLNFDTWRTRGRTFWGSLRLLLGIGCGVRLGACLMLRYGVEDAPLDVYPPGRIEFRHALVYNIACILFVLFALSPRCRRWTSDWCGLSSVILTLAELPIRKRKVCFQSDRKDGLEDILAVSSSAGSAVDSAAPSVASSTRSSRRSIS